MLSKLPQTKQAWSFILFKIKEVFNLVSKNKAFLFFYNIVDIKSYNFLTSNSKKNIIVPYK